MIKLHYFNQLLFCKLDCKLNNEDLHLDNVLIDTGSATTLINADYINFDGTETVQEAYGIGGSEKILNKQFSDLQINEFTLNNISISVGDMDYGLNIDMLLGLDLLKSLNAIVNLDTMQLEFK
ncbi:MULTISPECIES: retroviral-like aspartic protease family protein [Clostridium]|uniref:Aspartyl protease n=1 Tax=Clostridium carnis TaxID=1530 RepID=A0ABY6SRJ0_9CLOT|nr:retroviral-like aspartic protease family protein [Clostridium carnis]CAI3543081.1 Aspartyl protease [Clostridium neonatale]CAI3561757.1 Aspartyl protease [Clostridium neonatale]CAI3563000.1 Aspartyl protease [Clostridium neonatale]CAI3583970.1 Aspartyl protease [Clostridium neonatale]CAI3623716.1 Aspartyl protease [Clostridium neonatale]